MAIVGPFDLTAQIDGATDTFVSPGPDLNSGDTFYVIWNSTLVPECATVINPTTFQLVFVPRLGDRLLVFYNDKQTDLTIICGKVIRCDIAVNGDIFDLFKVDGEIVRNSVQVTSGTINFATPQAISEATMIEGTLEDLQKTNGSIQCGCP